MSERASLRVLLCVLMTGFAACARAQDSDPLTEIRDYQMETVNALGISRVLYLAFAKPYGRWDTRPLERSKVVIGREESGSKGVPNYLWGHIGTAVFDLSREELYSYPEDFLRQSYFSKSAYSSHLGNNKKGFLDLISAIRASKNKIFVQQTMLKENSYVRIDDVFREDGKYWRYIIPSASPYPMSSTVEELSGFKFGDAEEEILKKLAALKLYCAVKTPGYIVLMSGGMLDNSCGYIYATKEPTSESMGHLYNLTVVEPLGENWYFYLSN